MLTCETASNETAIDLAREKTPPDIFANEAQQLSY